MRLSVAVFSAFILTGLPALADELPRGFDDCRKAEEPDTTIAGCTLVIDNQPLAPRIHVAALFFRSMAFEAKSDPKAAMTDLNEAIRILPSFSHAYSARARLYKEAGDDEHAFADMNAAIRLAPGIALFYNRRGLFYFEKNNYEFAVDDFNEAIGLSPIPPMDTGTAPWRTRTRPIAPAPSPTTAK